MSETAAGWAILAILTSAAMASGARGLARRRRRRPRSRREARALIQREGPLGKID